MTPPFTGIVTFAKSPLRPDRIAAPLARSSLCHRRFFAGVWVRQRSATGTVFRKALPPGNRFGKVRSTSRTDLLVFR
jgi:hypothetical protein